MSTGKEGFRLRGWGGWREEKPLKETMKYGEARWLEVNYRSKDGR
jgi:hypothetical protein